METPTGFVSFLFLHLVWREVGAARYAEYALAAGACLTLVELVSGELCALGLWWPFAEGSFFCLYGELLRAPALAPREMGWLAALRWHAALSVVLLPLFCVYGVAVWALGAEYKRLRARFVRAAARLGAGDTAPIAAYRDRGCLRCPACRDRTTIVLNVHAVNAVLDEYKERMRLADYLQATTSLHEIYKASASEEGDESEDDE